MSNPRAFYELLLDYARTPGAGRGGSDRPGLDAMPGRWRRTLHVAAGLYPHLPWAGTLGKTVG
jgi:hypothetical protein